MLSSKRDGRNADYEQQRASHNGGLVAGLISSVKAGAAVSHGQIVHVVAADVALAVIVVVRVLTEHGAAADGAYFVVPYAAEVNRERAGNAVAVLEVLAALEAVFVV